MIVFSLSGVLTDQPSNADRRLIQRLAARPDEEFEADYHAHRNLYETGELTSEEYWSRVAPEAPDVEALTEADSAAFLNYRPDMLALVKLLPGPKAILANAPRPVARAADAAPWAGNFTHRIYSADIGVAKPDHRAYEAFCALVDLDPADLLLIDDRRENVVAARAFGLPSLLFADAAGLREALHLRPIVRWPAFASRPSPFSGPWWHLGSTL